MFISFLALCPPVGGCLFVVFPLRGNPLKNAAKLLKKSHSPKFFTKKSENVNCSAQIFLVLFWYCFALFCTFLRLYPKKITKSLHISKKCCNFAANLYHTCIMKTTDTKRIFTDNEIVAAIKGMMNAKNEWLQYVKQREAELGLA